MKYKLPIGVKLNQELPERYTKETRLSFIDENYGEFTSTVKALQDAGASTHPKAVQERRKNTNIKIYGCENPGANKEVQAKREATMVERWGSKNALENPECLKKAQATLRRNHGVDTPMESEELKNRQKNAIFENWGVDNIAKHPEIKQRLREKNVEIGQCTLLSNGLTINQFLDQNNLPFLSHAYFIRKHYGDEALYKWVENYSKQMSSLEILFKTILPEAEHFNKEIKELNRNYRPDFIYKGMYIEIDGLLYHSDKFKENKNFHLEKKEVFKSHGLKLLQFRENEIKQSPEIVKSIILAKAKELSNRVFARKCSIREVKHDEAQLFFFENHLMGPFRAAKNVGLYFDNQLVCCLAYFVKNNELEVGRFSSKNYLSVVGGLSRLLTHLEKLGKPSKIISYVDLRYGDGSSLNQLGFSHIKTTLGWCWTDGYDTFHRLRCRANMDDRFLSENEYAEERKWYRIYDAGQAKYEKSYSNQV